MYDYNSNCLAHDCTFFIPCRLNSVWHAKVREVKQLNSTIVSNDRDMDVYKVQKEEAEAETLYIRNELLELEDDVHLTRRALCNPGCFPPPFFVY